jgi:hypothetical protein
MTGLKELIFGDHRDPRAVIDETLGGRAEAVAWARGVLAEQGIDPAAAPVDAVRAVRNAEPELGLKASRYLVDSLGRSA